MNANELVEKCGLMIEDYDFGIEVATMLRQQQAEIEALKVKAHEWYLIAMGKAQEK